MAHKAMQMTAHKRASLQEIHQAIHLIAGAEMVCQHLQTIHDVTILSLVYEKYYFRSNNYASLTVILTEFGEEQTACIAVSGAASGLANFAYGADSHFAKSCIQALESCGFTPL